MTITKFWRCPKCGYLTTNEEMQSIVFDPECRCYEETGMTWARFIPVIDKIKCKCGKDWKIQDNLSAYKGEVVLVCDCGERFYNAQDFFDDHCFINLCHVVIKGEN